MEKSSEKGAPSEKHQATPPIEGRGPRLLSQARGITSKHQPGVTCQGKKRDKKKSISMGKKRGEERGQVLRVKTSPQNTA